MVYYSWRDALDRGKCVYTHNQDAVSLLFFFRKNNHHHTQKNPFTFHLVYTFNPFYKCLTCIIIIFFYYSYCGYGMYVMSSRENIPPYLNSFSSCTIFYTLFRVCTHIFIIFNQTFAYTHNCIMHLTLNFFYYMWDFLFGFARNWCKFIFD